MMDNYSIDNHKLMYHPERVYKWMKGDITYPIFTEISLTSRCNNRCKFCAYNFFLNYKSIDIDTDILINNINSMKDCGVKAIMYGGEGEPLLHKDFAKLVSYTNDIGIDVSLTTNGLLFDSIMAKRVLPYLSWVKFSIDAGTSEDYAFIHGTSKENYKKVLDNISRASFIKRLKKYDCTIGTQVLLFKENIDNLEHLIKFLVYAKPDYLVIKPYSENKNQNIKTLHQPTKNQVNNFKKMIKKYEDKLNIIFREKAFENIIEDKSYDICYASEFMAYINTLGDVYSCTNFLGFEEYKYGNIYKDSFKNIWKNIKEINIDISKCRKACRLDPINRYLWRLKNPQNHDNFI